MSSETAGNRPAASGVQHYRRCYRDFTARHSDPAWLRGLRDRAMADFCANGFPTRRLEAWRYTSVEAIERADFEPVTGCAEPEQRLWDAAARPRADATRIVFLDGRFCRDLSDEPEAGVHVAGLAQARAGGPGAELLERGLAQLAPCKGDSFTALNTAFLDDGALIEVDECGGARRTIHLLFCAAEPDRITNPRILLRAGARSRLTLLCEFVSLEQAAGLTNLVCEFEIAQEAQIESILAQHEGSERFHVSNLQARLERGALFRSHTLSLGGRMVRNELAVNLAGEGASTKLHGLFVGRERRHIDNHTLVDHAMPHCTSDELYKGVLFDRSRGVFRGRVSVRPDAQKSDARQSNPNLLLSDRAEIDTRPQLEIRADDVRCSHGSSIGRLDEEALFYLLSRGIGLTTARTLLTRGFAGEIVRALPQAEFRDWAEALLDESLGQVPAATCTAPSEEQS